MNILDIYLFIGTTIFTLLYFYIHREEIIKDFKKFMDEMEKQKKG